MQSFEVFCLGKYATSETFNTSNNVNMNHVLIAYFLLIKLVYFSITQFYLVAVLFTCISPLLSGQQLPTFQYYMIIVRLLMLIPSFINLFSLANSIESSFLGYV